MKNYKSMLDAIKKDIPDTRVRMMFTIVTDVDGTIRVQPEEFSGMTFLSIEDAENAIMKYSEENNKDPFILKFEVVDNKKKILGDLDE